MFPGQPQVSYIPFVDLDLFNVTFVIAVSLDERLIKHIRHQLVTGRVSHLARHGLHSLLASVEILHINTNETVISRIPN